MSRCLAPCAPAKAVTGRCHGRWHGCGRAPAQAEARRERLRRLGRIVIYLLLFLLPGGGVWLLVRWLHSRFIANG